MIGFSIGAEFEIEGLDRSDLKRLFDLLGAALIAKQTEGSNVLDHSVSIDLGRGLVEIMVTAAGPTRAQAEALAEKTIADVLVETGGEDVNEVMEMMRHDIGERSSGNGVFERELVPLGA